MIKTSDIYSALSVFEKSEQRVRKTEEIRANARRRAEELAVECEYCGVDIEEQTLASQTSAIFRRIISQIGKKYEEKIDNLKRETASDLLKISPKIEEREKEIDRLKLEATVIKGRLDYFYTKKDKLLSEHGQHIVNFCKTVKDLEYRISDIYDRRTKEILDMESYLKKHLSNLPVTLYADKKPVSITDFKDGTKAYYETESHGKTYNPVILELAVGEPAGMTQKAKMFLKEDYIRSLKMTVSEYNLDTKYYYCLKEYTECFLSENTIKQENEKRNRTLKRIQDLQSDHSLEKERNEKKFMLDLLANNGPIKLLKQGHLKPLSADEVYKICKNEIDNYYYPHDLKYFLKDPYKNAPADVFELDLDEVCKIFSDTYVEDKMASQTAYHLEVKELQERTKKQIEALPKVNIESVFSHFAQEYPLYCQMAPTDGPVTRQDVDKMIAKIAECAKDQYYMPFFTSPVVINKNGYYVPDYVPVCPHPTFGKSTNLVINYSGNEDNLKKILNRTILNVLLTLPPGQIKLRFIDLGATNTASLFTTRLHQGFFSGETIIGEKELRDAVAQWQDKVRRISRKCEAMYQYNAEHHTWLEPYEVVVVLGYPKSMSPGIENMLRPFVENGYKSGIFFVFANCMDVQPASGVTLLQDRELFKFVDSSHVCKYEKPLSYLPLADYTYILDSAFEYLNKGLADGLQKPPVVQNVRELASGAYDDAPLSDISVPVGVEDGNVVKFELDTVSHLHAFILGQSGTGKSSFLHNIIGNILFKYSPSQIELYLLDLKLGGVEFNQYKGEKHVRALLVDNNDRRITLEILKNLESRMEERSKEFARVGARNLEMYNSKAEVPMPQLVLVIDECQMIFSERPDNVEKEIRRIISLTAKQGRSQGVHMIFSTQTFMNSAIPIDELQGAGLTDLYLLNCDRRDSEKLASGSSAITSELTTGEIYYHHHQNSSPDMRFRSYYATDRRQAEMLEAVSAKTASYNVEAQYYFSGKVQAVLNEDALETLQKKNRRSLCLSPGTMLSFSHECVTIPLREEQGENILVFGLNQRMQSVRQAVEIFLSGVYAARRAGRDTAFYVIDCLSEDDSSPYQEVFDALEEAGSVTIVYGRQRGELLKELGDKVRKGSADETLVLVLGQEKWRELKNEKELETPAPSEGAQSDASSFLGSGLSGGLSGGLTGGLHGGLGGGFSRAGAAAKRTFRSELAYLLENGSEQGVHFILQVDKPQNLLAGQSVSHQTVRNYFRHWLMLKSTSDAGMILRLRDDISLDKLSDDPDRLRAVYYSDDADTYKYITPYSFTTAKDNETFM